MRPGQHCAVPAGLLLASAMLLAGCGVTDLTTQPSPAPGVQARLHVEIVDVSYVGDSAKGIWNVKFAYNGNVITAPTSPEMEPPVDLVGNNAIIEGNVGQDGSFVITSIERDDR